MKSNPNIDELLCSFIDGELPARQKTEVQRMAARDPQVGQRLRQLQNCSNLIGALPRAEAPSDMIDQIRLSLERRTLLGDRPSGSSGRAGHWHLRLRHLTAAAAMIALLGVLGLVVYQIVSPMAPAEPTETVATTQDPTAPADPVPASVIVASEPGFSGRLEFRTAATERANSFILRAIEEQGLTEMVVSQNTDGKRTYRITCSQEATERLVASLGEMWRTSESAALIVESGRFNESVVIEPATLAQTAKIVGQDSLEACVAAAKLESLAQDMPGHRFAAVVGNGLDEVVSIPVLPRPVMTSNSGSGKTVPPATEGAAKTTLSIVLIDLQP